MTRLKPIFPLLSLAIVALSGDVSAALVRLAWPAEYTGDPDATLWRYYDQGAAQEGWQGTEFDDSSWEGGSAPLGFGDDIIRTEVLPGQNTVYFRATLDLIGGDRYFGASAAQLTRDDAAVVYLNGVEIFRSNLPEGAIDHGTPAQVAIGGDAETSRIPFSFPTDLLRDGRNVIAVEIHQSDPASSDLIFSLWTQAIRSDGEMVSARRLDDTAYFLTKRPSRLLRFDLDAGTWMQPLEFGRLNSEAEAFWLGEEEVYVITDDEVGRLTPGGYLPIANHSRNAVAVVGDGEVVSAITNALSGATLTQYRVATGEPIGSSPVEWIEGQIDMGNDGTIYGRTGRTEIARIELAPEGGVLSSTTEPTASWSAPSFPQGASISTVVEPGGARVFANGGLAHDQDTLQPLAATSHPYDFLSFLDDGRVVVLKNGGRQFSLLDAESLTRIGSQQLDSSARFVFAKNGTAYVFTTVDEFGAASLAVESFDLSSLGEPFPPPPNAIPVFAPLDSLAGLTSEAFLGVDGLVYLVVRDRLYGWEPGVGFSVAQNLSFDLEDYDYQPVRHALLAKSKRGLVEYDLNSDQPSSRHVTSFLHDVYHVTATDDGAFVTLDRFGSEYVDHTGMRLSATTWGTRARNEGFGWDRFRRRIFLHDSGRPIWLTVDENNQISGGMNDPSVSLPSLDALRLSDDGSAFFTAGSDRVIDADTFETVWTLPTSATDGVLRSGSLFTIRRDQSSTILEKWESPGASPLASLLLSGRPDRILANESGVYVIAVEDAGATRVVFLDSQLRILDRSPSPPSGPIFLTVTELRSDSIVVTWDDRSDNEDEFVVRYRAGGEEWNMFVLPADTSSTTITGLSPDTWYEILVSAQNSTGEDFSREIRTTTLGTGADPIFFLPTLNVEIDSRGLLEIRFQTIEDLVYRIVCSDDGVLWNGCSPFITGDGNEAQWTETRDDQDRHPTRLYRVELWR